MNHVAFNEALYWRVLAATAIVQRSDLNLVTLYQAYSASTLRFVNKVNKVTPTPIKVSVPWMLWILGRET